MRGEDKMGFDVEDGAGYWNTVFVSCSCVCGNVCVGAGSVGGCS